MVFNFYSFLLDNLVKNLSKHDFKYVNQEYDSKVLDLLKQEEVYPSYE